MLVDINTGEIVDTTTPSRRKGRAASTRKAVGLDTKYPCDCVTVDSLLDALYNLDSCLHYKPLVDHAYLTDAIVQKMLTINEVALLNFLCMHLVGWNYWIGNVVSLQELVTKAHVARTLRELEAKNALRVMHRDKPFRGDMVIKVHPVIGFRGDTSFRQMCLSSWYS